MAINAHIVVHFDNPHYVPARSGGNTALILEPDLELSGRIYSEKKDVITKCSGGIMPYAKHGLKLCNSGGFGMIIDMYY